MIYSNIKLEITVIDGLYQKIFKLEILKISVHMLHQMASNGSPFSKNDTFEGGHPSSSSSTPAAQPFISNDVALHLIFIL